MSKKKMVPLPVLPEGTQLIDTHCHLDMDAYDEDRVAVITRAHANGVNTIITIGIDLPSSRKAVALADRFPGLHATIGFHPHDAEHATAEALRELEQLANHPQVVGFGEIGLDYAKNYAPKDVQVQVFTTQLHLAKQLNLPIIIHDREAHNDTLSILKSLAPFPAGGVLHCFSGDVALAQQIIDLGFLISIPGVVTFNKAAALQQVAQEIPLEHLLVETDGPYLSPVPFRGKRNEPSYVLYTAQSIAQLRNCSLGEVARATTANATQLFRLKPRVEA